MVIHLSELLGLLVIWYLLRFLRWLALGVFKFGLSSIIGRFLKLEIRFKEVK